MRRIGDDPGERWVAERATQVSAADLIARLFIHTVTVDTLVGVDDFGAKQFAPTSAPIQGCLAIQVTMVRDATGSEVVSSTQFSTYRNNFDLFSPGSVVHLPGRDAEVITASYADDGGLLDLPANTLVSLT